MCDLKKLIGKEAWYTDKKKGFCHGIIEKADNDYCHRDFCFVNGEWIQLERLFPSRKSLAHEMDEYVHNCTERWTSKSLEKFLLGNVNFSVCWGGKTHPLFEE